MKIIRLYWWRALLCVLPLTLWLLFFQKQPGLPDFYIGKDASTILEAMPKGDRKKLEYFFRELIGWQGFGYVLLGEKPMAFAMSEEKINPFESLSRFRYTITPPRIRYARGFETWKKYENFFPTSRFAFFHEKYKSDDGIIILINKKTFVYKVQQYADDFKRILNREVTGEELLKERMNRPLFSNILMNHDGLIGTLLGYGRDNAHLFHQKSQLSSVQEKIDFFERSGVDCIWTEEECEDFRKKFESVGWVSTYITESHMKNLNFMPLPSFAAVFSSPETQYWRNHYLEIRGAIIEFYKDKDFLETTLKLLTS